MLRPRDEGVHVAEPVFHKGLEGVYADQSAICHIDGENGRLYYRGYSIEDLAEKVSFEEATYLLLHEDLPTPAQLGDFSARMRDGRRLGRPVLDMIRSFPPKAHPMELMQSVISYLSGSVGDTLHQVSQLASVAAAWKRFRDGKDYVPPRDDLSHGANFLYMLHGKEPTPHEGAIMDTCLVLHAEHGFNASTFTARVVASTLSTCYCSISAAIGALYGTLHGGANEHVMDMVAAIGSREKARAWVESCLARKEKIMGMGHREYKAKDPRSYIMERFLKELSEAAGDTRHYDILKEVESVFREKMGGKPVYPNVDFFSGSVYTLLGIPTVLFTPVFAASRVAGWLAHILEQRVDNRIYRPKSLYTGHEPRPVPPLQTRTGAAR
jgi:citrate synthase